MYGFTCFCFTLLHTSHKNTEEMTIRSNFYILFYIVFHVWLYRKKLHNPPYSVENERREMIKQSNKMAISR